MAQTIGYLEDNVTLTEGPFVICNPLGNGWRIEVELKGFECTVLPDASIYEVMKNLGLCGWTNDKEQAEMVCDVLNLMVQQGRIVLEGNWWIRKTN